MHRREIKIMRVTLSAPGRYWAFDLAHQLQKRDYLEQLITGYPRYEVNKYKLPSEKVITLPLNQIIYRGWGYLPHPVRRLYDPLFMVPEIFDRQARSRLSDCDIFVGWAGLCLHTLRLAKSRGTLTLVERGSAHMLFQQDIMKEEYARFGQKGNLAHPRIIERELQEYEEADYIVIPSFFAKRTFTEYGVNESKLIHIPFGVDLTRFPEVEKEDDVFRVVFAGGIGLRKGIPYLLQAFKELNLPKSELLLIGTAFDEIKPSFQKYEGSFKWIGPQPQQELYKYFSSGSVFVLPSIEDGFGMVMTQAMACGLPLICTSNTGGEDLINQGREGFIIPIRDVEALKEKLRFYYENPELRREMGHAARTRARGSFSWDDYGERTMGYYRKIIMEK